MEEAGARIRESGDKSQLELSVGGGGGGAGPSSMASIEGNGLGQSHQCSFVCDDCSRSVVVFFLLM